MPSPRPAASVVLAAVGALTLLSAAAPSALAQSCATPAWWNANEGLLPRINALVPLAFTTFDPDGPGPETNFLYVCGFFDFQSGGPLSAGIARWDGVKWIGVGTGLGAGGLNFLYDMCVWDSDGTGPLPPRLIVSGSFQGAGDVAVIGVAAWNGSQWVQVGEGISNVVWAMEPFDEDGDGPLPSTLIAGANAPLGVRKWNGTSWVSFGLSIDNVLSLESFDPDGAGSLPPELFALTYHSGVRRRVGNTWLTTNLTGDSSLDASPSQKLVKLDPDGAGPLPTELYAATGPGVYQWNGASWSPVTGSPEAVALGVHDPDGDGPARPWLLVASNDYVRAWDGSAWSVLGRLGYSPSSTSGGYPYSFGSFDPDGPGPQPPTLFAGGEFKTAGGVPSDGLARFGCPIDFGRCAADCSFNGVVDFHDITTILANWGSTDPYADGNRDGVVGFTDITLALSSWGEECPENLGAVPIPEADRGGTRPVAGPHLIRIYQAMREGGFSQVTRELANWNPTEPEASGGSARLDAATAP